MNEGNEIQRGSCAVYMLHPVRHSRRRTRMKLDPESVNEKDGRSSNRSRSCALCSLPSFPGRTMLCLNHFLRQTKTWATKTLLNVVLCLRDARSHCFLVHHVTHHFEALVFVLKRTETAGLQQEVTFVWT